jgi:radical SAM protein with 4Fe4S-binding SPASM domain
MEVATFQTKHIAPDFTNEDVSLWRQNTWRVKPEKCKRCSLYDKCEGIWVNYYERVWDMELLPML